MRRATIWLALAAILGGVTATVLHARGEVSLAGHSGWWQVVEIAGGAGCMVGAGVAPGGSKRWALVAAGASWLAAEWANPAAPGALIFTVGLASASLTLPFVLLHYRSGPAPVGWAMVGLASVGAVLSGPLTAAAASPRDAGCTSCPADLIALGSNAELADTVMRSGGWFTVAAGCLAVPMYLSGLLGRRRRDLVALARRGEPAVALAFAGAVATAALAVLRGGAADPAGYGLRAAASGALLALAVLQAAAAVRAAQAIRTVTAATLAASDQSRNSAVELLRRALRDADLRVVYPSADELWIGRDGSPASLPDRNVTLVTDNAERLAALIHGAAAAPNSAVVSGALSAARLHLDAERIEAGARARARDLRVARRMAADAADAARQRMERDLHDGAQQKLVALRFALGLARARAERAAARAVLAPLSEADSAAEQALAELRELAHGVTPGAMTVEGLAGAVHAMALHTTVAISISELPAERLSASTERRVYRIVSDALGCADRAGAVRARIAVRHIGDGVVIELDHDGVAVDDRPPFVDMADRVAALGATMDCTGSEGTSRMSAVLPCE